MSVAPPPRLPALLGPALAPGSIARGQQGTTAWHEPRGLGAGALRHGVLPVGARVIG
ncbi:hypothetical protein [Micromonospora deserti]|uniref:hypothetical protein n=1 Tax=Micromonospora deserti TaxID=2070366 RepID=UPI001313E087|nr:hypothetical protein [Micromonospora deserti]